MRRFFTQLFHFFQKETVLCIAALLAVVSAFFVPPSSAYLGYLDFRVLSLLLGLMLVVAGFQSIGLFTYLGRRLLRRIKGARQLLLLLIALCFFSGMLITNDVALITFVPFAILLLNMTGQEQLMIPAIVLETIAANLGSMLTPIGNPQNLYLYNSFRIPIGTFLLWMLPLTGLSLLLLLAAVLLLPRKAAAPAFSGIRLPQSDSSASQEQGDCTAILGTPGGKRRLAVYLLLFAVCLLCVLRLLPYPVMLLILGITILITDRSLFLKADYYLLLTFICFFVFIGNMQNIPLVSGFLQEMLKGRELFLSALASQGISNVPAAILLSGFTTAVRPLLYGVNIGGLGTLIASLASVISYRCYSNTAGAEKGRYLRVFTLYNVLFLLILLPAAWLLSR